MGLWCDGEDQGGKRDDRDVAREEQTAPCFQTILVAGSGPLMLAQRHQRWGEFPGVVTWVFIVKEVA